MTNADFPYVMQEIPDSMDHWASAWSLTEIRLPSGGSIEIDYEADEYSHVQDKQAMQMFPVLGVGNSTDFNAAANLYNNHYLYNQTPRFNSFRC